MTTLNPYDRIADRFIEADKELDKLPVRREAARLRREEERRRRQAVPVATPEPVPLLPPIPGPDVLPRPQELGPGPFFGQHMADNGFLQENHHR